MPRESRSTEMTRRNWLRLAASGLAVSQTSGWLGALAADAAPNPQRRRSCILLWMNGGPSQTDTFDMKPGHNNGGPFRAIPTTVPGLRFSEHLPKMAAQAEHLAIIRSMSTKEGDHGRASYFLRTGYVPTGGIQHPSIGSLVAKELADEEAELPSFVSIAPFRSFSPAAYGPGFLGNEFAPLVVGESGYNNNADYESSLKVKDMESPKRVDRRRADSRLGLLEPANASFIEGHPGGPASSHRTAFERAVKLMRSDGVKAFNIDEESPTLRDAYGRNAFGQGCLLARRLVERGVPFVDVTLGNVEGSMGFAWDTHQQNFEQVKKLSAVLDAGWATLLQDLNSRGLLESTTILWMGEFGRTPKINNQAGRDHFPDAWTTVLAGGGIRGGQAIGATSPDGTKVIDRKTSVGDLVSTLCHALGIDPRTQNVSNVGRPIRIADADAKPVKEALA